MQIISNNTGIPPSSLPIYENLFGFIECSLPDFTPLSKTNKGKQVDEEDDITEDLVSFFEDKIETLNLDENKTFKFTNQSKQGRNKTDIGVRLGRKYLASNRPLCCWIEAKRLPTPDSGRTRDEREYVFVDKTKNKFKGNGGIQRFKEGKHASTLPFSIMIGYIQSDDASYWIEQINGWIINLVNELPAFWNTNDCLREQISDKCNRYVSLHERENNLGKIEIHHFWINV
ncbi:hypothetical protein [Parabacteroides sp. Marseille-P3160]|uniref:hypothetical protein n=1 Tax=Parabacteroides sp. Marseille-P3160 TaxID=1917887 RepID=UPI0009B9584E|nr:hypothetical protein [Parabacteroides sp. Marseille-P3160]